MIVYIYKDYISDDEELMDNKIFNLLCADYKDIARVESAVEYEWIDVEEEECTLDEIRNYVDNGYIYIGDVFDE